VATMRILIVTNSFDLNNSIYRYLKFISSHLFPTTYTFVDLRVISREILERDFIITEVYRVSLDSIDDYGLDMFLSFLRMGKTGILLHVDRIEDLGLSNRSFLFKVPEKTKDLLEKTKLLESEEGIALSPDDIRRLKESFPHRTAKGHHRSDHEDFNP
jgi:hypothetical protein